eukprot:4343003-Amphidinium_carterae.1
MQQCGIGKGHAVLPQVWFQVCQEGSQCMLTVPGKSAECLHDSNIMSRVAKTCIEMSGCSVKGVHLGARRRELHANA